ncbi:MAG: YtxH domain-containing protein [Acidobacteriota bacterium]|nr:YtxH domain-containing protein [Acidobacteriota bacterium]
MSNQSDSGLAVLGAFIFGGLVGAAVALLTAPKTGKETREDLYRWTEGAAQKTREKVQTLAADTGEKVRSLAEDAGEKVRHVYGSAKDRFARGEEAADPDLPTAD